MLSYEFQRECHVRENFMYGLVGERKQARYRSFIRGDFTLLELLVVIAVIAILASMLLPALSNARKRAYSIACQSNQKQLAGAFMGYTADNDAFMPPALQNRCGLDSFSGLYDTTNGSVTWMAAICPYVGIKKITYGFFPLHNKDSVFLCPSILNPSGIYQDYGYNALLFCCALQTDGSVMSWAGNANLQKISNVKYASQSIMLVDTWGDTTTHRDGGYFLLDWTKPCYRHSRKANVTWVDGHVSAEGWECLNNPYGYGDLPYNTNNKATKWISAAARGQFTYGYAPYD